jgi:Putative DNA-binding domain
MDCPRDLAALQELLWRLITAPSGVAEGLANEPALAAAGGLDAIIAGDERMSAAERVEIYANGYFYRLLDVLKEDYPATLAVAGGDGFYNLVTGYLIDYPPSEPSIYYAGRHFADYLRAHPINARMRFVSDLAYLERAVLESFHAADSPALDGDAMRAIAPEAWPAVQMRTHPSVQLVTSAWRVDEVLRAVEENREWAAPPRALATIVVWRNAGGVRYRSAEQAERAALALAHDSNGTNFAAICMAIAGDAETEADTPVLIHRLLARWLADGLLVSPAP